MKNFEKKFVVREAECILRQCGDKIRNSSEKKGSAISAMIENKRLKRKNIFWRTASFLLGFAIVIILI